jgi:hypothetical protein
MIVSSAVLGARMPSARAQGAWAAGAALLVWCAWTIQAHGSPLRWLDYFVHIVSREDTDVAWLAASVRTWAFSWSALVTPAGAAVASVAAAAGLTRKPAVDWRRRRAAWIALVTAWLTAALTFSGMNITWTLGIYFAIPLFVVMVSLPWTELGVPRRLVTIWLILWLAASASIGLVRHARTAVTWAARDPAPLEHFVARHVPPGSVVVGPDSLYFFAIETSGASYRSWSPASIGDWARWVPALDAASPHALPRIRRTAPAKRFLIWQSADDVPDGYACAVYHRVAIYQPPGHHLDRLGPLGDVWDAGYPGTALYWLPEGCPTGYDPTRDGP